jgi:O-acetyl-ADP-ribose deacetylase (regulator of RNase III)
MKYQEIDGDLIKLTRQGLFDVIVHGCNCFGIMGAGVALQIAKEFGANKFPLECGEFIGVHNKLGQIDCKRLFLEDTGKWTPYPDEGGRFVSQEVVVVNAYTQFSTANRYQTTPLDYEALTLCLRKINHQFKGEHIGLPQIGCGLADGDWEKVKLIIQQELKDCKVTVVIYKKVNNE